MRTDKNEGLYSKPSAVPPPHEKPAPIDPIHSPIFNNDDLDALNLLNAHQLKEIQQQEKEKIALDSIEQIQQHDPVSTDLFEKAQLFEDKNPTGDVRLKELHQEMVTEKDQKTKNEQIERSLFLEQVHKKSRIKVVTDPKVLVQKKRQRDRRTYRLIIRKVFWKIFIPKAKLVTMEFFEVSIKQKCLTMIQTFKQKRLERQQLPKRPIKFFSLNKHYKLREGDVWKAYSKRIKTTD